MFNLRCKGNNKICLERGYFLFCSEIYMIDHSKEQLLSPRKKKTQLSEVKQKENQLYQFIKLILPPFIMAILTLLFKLLTKSIHSITKIFTKSDLSESSKEFNRRAYEEEIESLGLRQDQLGFTNQVLIQQDKKSINFYLPVYLTCKIKSIQDVSIQSLTGNISCAVIVNVAYGQLPQYLVKRLQSSIKVQINSGQVLPLADDGLNITVKRNSKVNFLIFTIRKVFQAIMIEDTLWSPFEMLKLIVSFTFNTVTIPANSIQSNQPGLKPNKEYKISFNCMRNSDPIAMSYALDCVYGIYDLAEKRLESYHSRFGTYKEIQKNYEQIQTKKKKEGEKKKEKEKKEKQEREKEKEKEKNTLNVRKKDQEETKTALMAFADQEEPNIYLSGPKEVSQVNLIKNVVRSTIRRLSMRVTTEVKPPPKKVKYFQYTHLVIPLYKYPGNSIITIFLPTFLLALLSLAIFFQEPQLSGRIGAIATMILGYIALIPSIKDRLPPSSQLTVIESVVYIETICCMLILYESFMIRNIEEYEFIWHQNFCFLLCLGVHSCTFLFVAGLYIVHKLKWEPSYNYNQKIVEIKPADNITGWDNPYCDIIFAKYNQDILKSHSGSERNEKMIRPFNREPTSLMDINIVQAPSNVSLNQFKEVSKEEGKKTEKREKEDYNRMQGPTSPRSIGQFVLPSQQLYYGKQKCS